LPNFIKTKHPKRGGEKKENCVTYACMLTVVVFIHFASHHLPCPTSVPSATNWNSKIIEVGTPILITKLYNIGLQLHIPD
jgi:hypothetical protein